MVMILFDGQGQTLTLTIRKYSWRPMKTATSFALILALLTQPMAQATLVTESTFETARASALGELDALTAELEADTSPSDRKEERARKKIERRFQRQFAKFAERTYALVTTYSEAELRASLEEYTIRNEGLMNTLSPNGMGQDPIEGILGEAQQGKLKDALLTLSSEERRAELHDRLNAEIKKAGSARNFLKQTRATMSSLNICAVKQIALFGIIVPAGGALVLGAVGLGFVLAFGGTFAGIGTWGTIGIMAGGVSAGGAGTLASLKYLGSKRGNCRLEKRR